MSSIGSGKNGAQAVQDAIYQNLVDNVVDATSAPDEATGEKRSKRSAPKTKAALGSHGAMASEKPSMGSALGAPREGRADVGQGTGALAQADAAAPSAIPSKDLEAVSGLAQGAQQAQGQQLVQDASKVLSKRPPAKDEDVKKAFTDFTLGMQSMGRSAETRGELNTLLTSTAKGPVELSHRQKLAAEVGIDLSSDVAAKGATSANLSSLQPLTVDTTEVADAKQQLAQDLADPDVNEEQITQDIAAFQHAMDNAGRGDEVGSQLRKLTDDPSASANGQAAALAAAALLGIMLPDSQKGQVQDVSAQAKMAKVDKAIADAQQKKQAEQQAQQQQQAKAMSQAPNPGNGGTSGSGGGSGGSTRSNATPSGTAAADMAGATGDISNLAAKSGAVKGDFKMGLLPDYDNGSTNGATGFVQRTGVRPAQVGGYVDARADGTFDSGAADRWIQDAIDNKIPTVSLSISAWGTGQLSAEQVNGIKAAVDKGRAAGLEVDIRFGYEMNYGGGGGEQGGRVTNNNNTSAFKEQWAQVAAVVNPDRDASPPAKMIWSPNVWSGGDLPYADWLPDDPSTIDVVGLDYYHKSGDPISVDSISGVMDPLYKIAEKLNVPFIFGETGVQASGEDGDEKTKWLDLLSSSELRDKYPNYQGFYWFDYNKGGTNFSLSQDDSARGPFKQWYDQTFSSADGSSSQSGGT